MVPSKGLCTDVTFGHPTLQPASAAVAIVCSRGQFESGAGLQSGPTNKTREVLCLYLNPGAPLSFPESPRGPFGTFPVRLPS